jgi:hypothetical protein
MMYLQGGRWRRRAVRGQGATRAATPGATTHGAARPQGSAGNTRAKPYMGK